ncbi:MAG: apolipoprotein N-acyltransferase [Bacteroidetes bacterium]|nr:apolipoprotein N-acyltransferase [Bacteroidota bacterium]
MSRLKNPWALSLLTAALLSVAWPPMPVPFFVFLALVPLLMIEDHHYQVADKPLQYYLQISLSFTVWNAVTTYWTWFASPAGAAAAILLNAQLQTLPWLFYHRVRKTMQPKLAFPALIAFSLSIEYLHLNWDLAWPWLNLGNVFAKAVWSVQWYEITGVLGGSLWIYLVNISVFKFLINSGQNRAWLKPTVLIVVPLMVSGFFLYRGKYKMPLKQIRYETVVVQPNIDPYSDKFGGMSPEEQLVVLMRLSDSMLTENTRLLVWPETSITDYLEESDLQMDAVILKIQEWLKNYPKTSLLAGANTVKYYQTGERHSETARRHPAAEDLYYDVFNTALFFDDGKVGIYHKSKLVPGVEKMPYPAIFGFLEKLTIDLGGTSGSLGSSDSAAIFSVMDTHLKIAPIICYESVFGEYVGEYVRNGANLLVIITNDGWWKDTPGYKQHFLYARLRAIENRMYVARSANTGVSGFISPMGDVLMQSDWWTQDALRYPLPAEPGETFYSQSGDYIGKIAAFFSILILVGSFVRRKTARGY